jgi:hypothetical protein
MKGSLQASLNRLGQDFTFEIAAACRALLPVEPRHEALAAEAGVAARYEQWRKTNQVPLFARIAIATAGKDGVALRAIDLETGVFAPAEWPAAWAPIKDRLEFRLSPEPWRERLGPVPNEAPAVIELPLMNAVPAGPAPGPPPLPFGKGESEWLVVELNLRSIRELILPELVRRHLGGSVTSNYQVEVVTRSDPPAVIYQSDPGRTDRIARHADASAGLFEFGFGQVVGRRGPPGAPALG